MPAFASDSALRSALRSIEEELENRGVRVPPEARGAYQDLYLENTVLRLYAITWILPLTPDTQGWTLLVVLGTPSDTHLPVGTQLRVQDETQLLVEQVLEEEFPDAYLYAQVGGTWNERFWVTIDITPGTP
ncbi:MAG: DUF1822 family protein [Leptolyngbyaceae cyanobacterium RU_5_1]|nr:DUF1822 family protein [Leptolyngbyaceae cyanobacterium RU_5_1]